MQRFTFLGTGRKIFEFNLPRDCIRNYFPTRRCFAFPQPVHDRKMLKDLETLEKSDLDPEFIDISDDFVKHVSRQLKSKTIQGRPVTGSGKDHKSILFGDKSNRSSV